LKLLFRVINSPKTEVQSASRGNETANAGRIMRTITK
jgi:hypothetical protein